MASSKWNANWCDEGDNKLVSNDASNTWGTTGNWTAETSDSSECGDYRDAAGVLVPDLKTILAWESPSLFNGSSLKTVLFNKTTDDGADGCTASKKRPSLHLLHVLPSANTTKEDVCGPKPGLRLRLERILAIAQDEEQTASQVFQCAVIGMNEKPDDKEQSCHSTSYIVLKLYTDQKNKMPSNIKISPEDVLRQDDPRKPCLGRNAQMIVSVEASITEKLSPIQGICTPYSYGFYDFVLPCGTGVIGHVQEFVPSVEDIESYFYKFIRPDFKLVDAFFTAILETVLEYHRLDVAHGDYCLRNLRLIPTSEPSDLRFVLVDFTMAFSITLGEKFRAIWQNVVCAFLSNMLENIDPQLAQDWEATERGQKSWRMVYMNPEKLAKYEASHAAP